MAERRGISLLEVFLSLLLLGVVFGVWILGHFGRSEVTLESAERLLVEDLHAAQSRALVHGDATLVLFEGNRYWAVDSHRTALIHPRTGLDFARDYGRDAVFEGVSIELVETEALDGILFDARGEIASGGRIVLRFGDDRREIRVDSDNGTISTQELGVGLGPGAGMPVVHAQREGTGGAE
ncbi:MAG: GspH/FimT family protein [Planctomycetota bacterium]